MIRSHVLRGQQVSDLPHAKLTAEAINTGQTDEEITIALDILHRPESIGQENVAYIIFGVPVTSSYTFMDLNNLPPGIKVCVSVERNGTAISVTEFDESGATPQPLG